MSWVLQGNVDVKSPAERLQSWAPLLQNAGDEYGPTEAVQSWVLLHQDDDNEDSPAETADHCFVDRTFECPFCRDDDVEGRAVGYCF